LIRATRTNSRVTRFGVLPSVKPPAKTVIFNGPQTEGSTGRLDVVVNALAIPGPTDQFWHTTILAGLSLAAQPLRIGHTTAAQVIFMVTEAGQAGVWGFRVLPRCPRQDR
jgi:hypothetical protein